MTRSRVALALLVTLLGVAPPGRPAAAGVLSTPFSPGNCPEPDVADFMDDPDVFVQVDPGPCKALCKRAAAECKQFAKGAVACVVGVAKSELRYSLQNCALVSTPQNLKACKAAAASTYKSTKASALADLPGVLGNCKAWGESCRTACEAPPL